jgi:hypothetical protein
MAYFLDVVVLGIRMDAGFSEDVPPIMINLIFPQSGALIQERFLMVWLTGLPFVRQGISQPYDTVQVSTAVDFSEPFSCCNNGAAGRRWLHQLQHTKTTRVISYDVQQTNRTRSVCRCGTVAKVARNSLPSTCQTDDVH